REYRVTFARLEDWAAHHGGLGFCVDFSGRPPSQLPSRRNSLGSGVRKRKGAKAQIDDARPARTSAHPGCRQLELPVEDAAPAVTPAATAALSDAADPVENQQNLSLRKKSPLTYRLCRTRLRDRSTGTGRGREGNAEDRPDR